MTTAPKLQQILEEQHADYELIAHAPTSSPMESARVCHIAPERIAKAVLLDTEEGYLLAVLPANRRVDLHELRSSLGSRPHLADETEVAFVFDDCAVGAVPPLGFGYGVPTIIDQRVDEQPDLYFEAGDHASLVHMSHTEFARLTRQARHGRFSGPSPAVDASSAGFWYTT